FCCCLYSCRLCRTVGCPKTSICRRSGEFAPRAHVECSDDCLHARGKRRISKCPRHLFVRTASNECRLRLVRLSCWNAIPNREHTGGVHHRRLRTGPGRHEYHRPLQTYETGNEALGCAQRGYRCSTVGFGGEESSSAGAARQTCLGSKDDHWVAKEGSLLDCAHCLELESIFDQTGEFKTDILKEFIQSHFGLINGPGRRFSRE